MPRINEKIFLALCLTLSLAQIYPTLAAEDTSASILKFQQTMAQKGHASAQYTLAMMYETGDGVEQNLETARSWYQQAASQAYKPASHRLIYLDIVQTHRAADRSWLKQVHKDAQSGDGEAMLLLGQMYATGTGITQELTVASRYLRKAAADNIPGSEAELIKVEKIIEQTQAEKLAREKQPAEADKKPTQQKADAEMAEQARIKRMLLQKQLADAQSNHPQQPVTASQVYTANARTPVKAPALTVVEVVTPPPSAVSEIDMSPCSGRNRFVATCR